MNRRTALISLAGCFAPLQASGNSRVPVLVELFTSEGCSSCPPADQLLTRLDRHPPPGIDVIALSEHVDYWNHLGWEDPFSSAVFSARQHRYAERFRMDSVYTPQMVIHGAVQVVGSESRKVLQALEETARAPRASMGARVIRPEQGDPSGTIRLRISAAGIPVDFKREDLDVLLAITESGVLSAVPQGENAGRRLAHTGVVRHLTRVAGIQRDSSRGYSAELMVTIDSEWNRDELRAAVFLQGRRSHGIAGAASSKL